MQNSLDLLIGNSTFKQKMKNLIFFFLAAIFLGSCAKKETGWTNLLDKDLSQWNSYLSYRHKLGYDGQVPKNGEGKEIPPIGLNQDKYNVFTVNNENGELVLKVSGEIYGCVFTKKDYANYHLRLKVRWR